ncbi:MAG: hypothetical protein HQK49_06150 [Oligoflexia bacterium]|nr:hypothetical protein [Oligoflexia bacterium]
MWNRLLFYFCFCLISLSCYSSSEIILDSDNEINDFINTNYPLWSSSYHVDLHLQHNNNIDNNSNNNNFTLFGAPGSWNTLARLHILLQKDKNTQLQTYTRYSCLLFKLPHNKIYSSNYKITTASIKYLGELKVINNLSNLKSCDDLFFVKKNANNNNDNNNIKIIHYIHRLYFNFDGSNNLLKLWGQVYNFKKTQLTNFSFEIPLYNMKYPNESKKFSSNISKKIIDGVTIFPIIYTNSDRATDRAEDEITIDVVRNITDRSNNSYSNGDLIKCYDVNNRGEIITPHSCDKCKYGHFEVIKKEHQRFPESKTKLRYCGISKCGEPKEPACPRGRVVFFRGISNSLGICNYGLYPKYDKNDVLICDTIPNYSLPQND